MVLLIQAKNTSHLLRLPSYSKTSKNLLTRITHMGPHQCYPLKKPGTFTLSELSLWLLHPDQPWGSERCCSHLDAPHVAVCLTGSVW